MGRGTGKEGGGKGAGEGVGRRGQEQEDQAARIIETLRKLKKVQRRDNKPIVQWNITSWN